LSDASRNIPKENKDSKKTEEAKNTNPFAFLIPNAFAEVSSEHPSFRFWWIAISSPRVLRNLKREIVRDVVVTKKKEPNPLVVGVSPRLETLSHNLKQTIR